MKSLSDISDTTFSPNSSIDAAIKDMLSSFDEASQRRMRTSILNAKKSAIKHHDENTDASARHIFREFIPASILNQNGFSFEYEKSLQGKKPDWLDLTARMMVESYTFERGGFSSFLDRLTSFVTFKFNKYNSIIAAYSLRFVVAVYIDFLSSGPLLDEVREDPRAFRSLFDANDLLWAILFFTETQKIFSKQQYGFFCLCVDTSFEAIPNWPFDTIKCT